MKKKTNLIIVVMVVFAFMLTGITPIAYGAGDFIDNFGGYDSANWSMANWPNGSPFNCVFRPSQVTFSNDKMMLNLTVDDTGSGYPYKSGEYRTNSTYGYGYYEVKMKPVKNIGTVSSFFTYTGSPWDEIDIEFLGKDTTKVQFNWYKSSKGGHEYLYNLGFDASQSFHVYGFEWRSTYISYYVDGVKVYTGTADIPVTPGQIMMNLWPGIGVDGWLGAYDGKTPLVAEYEYAKYSSTGPSTSTPTPTPSTATATPTPTPSTATPTPTPSTATPTPTPGTATSTPTPSTATPTPTPTAGTPLPGGIKVQFFNGNTAATTNTLYPNFKVVNTGTAAINLSDVKMRYYFTNDGTQADSFACDYSTIGSGNVTGSFTTIAKTNADRYLEVGFTSAAGTLGAGASAEVKGRVWKSDWSNFTQTNDYSFNATATNYVDATTVTGYLAGALKWGTEP